MYLSYTISETFKIAKNNIPIISDGGIKYSGDIAKAIAFGADVVMIGSLFAEQMSHQRNFLSNGRTYKSYKGMGSLGLWEGFSRQIFSRRDNK